MAPLQVSSRSPRMTSSRRRNRPGNSRPVPAMRLSTFINRESARPGRTTKSSRRRSRRMRNGCARVYLDIVGHIPAAEEVERFIADKDKAKRTKLIEKLLDDPGYVRNWTTIWTNLSHRPADAAAGRAGPGMQKFFREAFAEEPALERDRLRPGLRRRALRARTARSTFCWPRCTDPRTTACRRRRRRPGCSWACRCNARSATTIRSTNGSRTSSGSSTASSGRRGEVDHRKYDPKTGRHGRRLLGTGHRAISPARSTSRSATA